ncbi:MAG TPA: hypothetical protein VEA99_11575 [Gemmatimonadaceae bacterium]|nr:hypothetical protein [Gemmatimonadaceae bacterium]
MQSLLLSLVVGMAVGALTGWFMRSVVRMPRTDLVAGALGALAVTVWGRSWGAEAVALGIALAIAGATGATFVAHLAAQARRREPVWASEPELAREPADDTLLDAGLDLDPGPASVATREHPLLVLHGGHTLRCWPSGDRPGSRLESTPAHLEWAVEVDGMTERAGPSSSPTSTGREVAATVRRWWDDRGAADSAGAVAGSPR